MHYKSGRHMGQRLHIMCSVCRSDKDSRLKSAISPNGDTNMQKILPDYLALSSALDKLDTEITPSEVHGTLCGLLCANSSALAEVWQQSLWPNKKGDLLAGEAFEVFNQAHDVSRTQLNDPDCDFQMILPDDDDALDDRVFALGDWCQGYLTGLVLGGIKDFSPLPDDAQEIAKDIVEIARAGTSYQLEGSEEDEHAYAELVEYLRVGVLLINEELQPTQAAPQSNPTLH